MFIFIFKSNLSNYSFFLNKFAFGPRVSDITGLLDSGGMR